MRCNYIFPMMLSYNALLYYGLILLLSHFEFRECTDIMLVATKRHKSAEKEHMVSSMTASQHRVSLTLACLFC